MLKKSLLCIVALVLTISALGCSQSQPAAKPADKPAAPAEIHIPVIAPLSGPNASGAGKAAQEGIGLAVKGLNDKGGVQGKKIVIDWLDDRGEASEAAVLAQKVADNKNYGVVIAHFSSDACFAALPIYEKAGLAMVTPWASHAELTTRSAVSFRMSGATSTYGRLNGDVLADTIKAKKVAILVANAEYHKDHTKYLKERLAAKNVQVVREETYMIGDSDFKPQITNIINAKPDAVAIVGYPKETALIINQLRDMKFKGPITLSPAASAQEVIDLAGKNMDPAYMGAGGDSYVKILKGQSTANPVAVAFINAYRAEYKKDPPASGGWESQSYDVMRVVASVMEKAGNDRKGIMDGLKATKGFQGVTGTLFGDDRAQVSELGISKYDPAQKQWANIQNIK